jgi:hypothetical protein
MSLVPASCWFLAWLILRLWRCRWYVRPKRLLTFNALDGVLCQKVERFITTVVRTLKYLWDLWFHCDHYEDVMWRRVVWYKFTDISEEDPGSISRLECTFLWMARKPIPCSSTLKMGAAYVSVTSGNAIYLKVKFPLCLTNQAPRH